MRSFLVGVAILLAIPGLSLGQPAGPNVTVSTSEMELVTDGLTVRAEVKNGSGFFVSVLNMQVDIPGEFVVSPRSAFVEFDEGAFDLNPRTSRWVETHIPEVSLPDALKFILFRHRPYVGTVRVQYEILPNREIHKAAPKTFVLNPLSPWWAVAVGGVVGVPIVVAFRRLYEKFKGTRATTRKPRIWVTIVFGWLVVIIATFIFRFTSTELPGLPVAINVKDFYGGVIVGLMFEPLSRWLSRVLLPETIPPTPSAGAPGTPTGS